MTHAERACPHCNYTGTVHCGDVTDKIKTNGGQPRYCSNAMAYGLRPQPAAMNVVPVNFGAAADLRRAELADALAEIAEHIRAGELEHPPHGWVLLLHSDDAPGGFEVLNKGVRTKQDMERATLAMRRHIATT